MPKINVNNANFYYESHGKGEPLILIAGYTCDHTVWSMILDKLSQQFQVIIFDNRGVGQTVDQGETLTAELMAKDVIALAEALNLEKPHVVGQSMGGNIALQVAHDYPEKISKLGILNSSTKWRTAMLKGLYSLLVLRQKHVDVDILIDTTLPWVFGGAFLDNPENIVGFKQAAAENRYPQTLVDQQRQFNVVATFNGSKYLKNIKNPTLIAYGKEDIISLPYESEYLAENIPNAQLAEFDCGHGFMLELPKQVSEQLISFLKN